MSSNMNSDTGAADLASPDKKGDDSGKKQRHKVTFMDDVTGDKSKLTEVH